MKRSPKPRRYGVTTAKSYSIFFLSFLLLIRPLSALVEEIIDPKSAPTIILSTTAPNRITFEGGAITDIIFDESKFQSFLHQKTGQAFLTPIKEMKESPTTITIVTSSGEVQTLQILAEERPGEVVLLKEKESLLEEEKKPLSSDCHSSTINFLNDLVSGKLPNGYGMRSIKEGQFVSPAPLRSTIIHRVEGPFEEFLVIELYNSSRGVEHLNGEALKRPNDRWIFLSKTHLAPKEKVLAIISTKKERV